MQPQTTEPFDLPAGAIERIARDAGAEDANAARRILRAYWFSTERRHRDAALVRQGRRERTARERGGARGNGAAGRT
jgi:hypothetical protein